MSECELGPATRIPCNVCMQPMRHRRTLTGWHGDFEHETWSFECGNACQVTAEVTYRRFIPIDVARMQP